MDTKLKDIKLKDYIIYIVISLLVSITILSAFEVKNNLRFISTKGVYTNTEVANTINEFVNMAMDYSLYYKSEKYTSNIDNITKNDIDICKAEINQKIEDEYSEVRDNKYYYDSEFNELSYEEQQKILKEERAKIEEKYNFTDEGLKEYILERKKNSFKTLDATLKGYKNLKFSAYDRHNDIWINGTNSESKSSIYLKEIKQIGNTLNETIYINGKDRTHNSFIDNFILTNNDRYNYTYHYGYGSEVTYDDTAVLSRNNNIELSVWIPKELEPGDILYDNMKIIEKNREKLLISSIIMVISVSILITIMSRVKRKKEKIVEQDYFINKFKDYPLEYKIGVALVSWIIWEFSIQSVYVMSGYITRLRVWSVIWCSICIIILYLLIKVIFANIKEGTLFKNNLSIKWWKKLSDVMQRGSIIKTIIIMTIIYGVIGIILFIFAVTLNEIVPLFFIAGLIMTLIYAIIIIRKLFYLDKIMVGAKDAAEGRLNYTIEEKGNGHLKELAHNINNIREGLKKSVQNEMKSENMKTELITNVSHDLKTPLTSIINYVELLKREDIKPETARDYINILDKKSQRLKILIEDLFEASKAASGAMELEISKIEVVQLLRQALGENDEKFNENNLNIRFSAPEEKVYINGDGKRLYRVFENLISNISKYSLENTRVYIDVIKFEEEVCITMRNISSYELNFDSSEITNRFKRGDKARTTEGSGLGLAIAKSIVELHHGEFKIEIDRDLFKSIIKLKTS